MLLKRRPSLNEIEALFRREIEPELQGLESQRKSILISISATIIAAAPVGAPLLLSDQHRQSGVLPFLLIGTLLTGGIFASLQFSAYKKHFKERVMKPVARRFFPELRYEPEAHVSKAHYDHSDLFRKDLHTFSGNDYFSGRAGEVDFEFSELLCRYTTGAGKKQQIHTAFRGFFFVGDFHRPLQFRTKIVPDTAESVFGVAGRGIQRLLSSRQEQLVDLEHAEFEQLFKVTSSDQVEARFILTPKLMEKLVGFRKLVGNEIHLSFRDSRLYLAISTHHDYFEPNLFGEVLSGKDLMKFIDMLILLLGVADEFCLQPRVQSGESRPTLPPLPPIAQKGFVRTLPTAWKSASFKRTEG